jgi:hypothetical protein
MRPLPTVTSLATRQLTAENKITYIFVLEPKHTINTNLSLPFESGTYLSLLRMNNSQ